MKNLEEIKNHLFSYESSLNEQNRNKLGEVFTPTDLVEQMLSYVDKSLFTDYEKTVIDNGCGSGNMLAVILYKRLKNNLDFEKSLSTIYGVDINEKNVKLCRDRLLCGRQDLRHIVETNIVCADAMRYTYKFLGPGEKLYEDDEAQQEEFNEHFNNLFEPLDN